MNRPARPRPPALRPARCEKMRPGRYRRIRSGARVRAAQRPSRTVAGRLIAERRACRCRNPGSARQVARPRRELRPGRRGPARTDRGIQARRRERARTARRTVSHGKAGHRARPRPARHRGRRREPVPPADRSPGPPRPILRRVRHRAGAVRPPRVRRPAQPRGETRRAIRGPARPAQPRAGLTLRRALRRAQPRAGPPLRRALRRAPPRAGLPLRRALRRDRQSRELRRPLPGPRPGGQGPHHPLRLPAGRPPRPLETGRHRPRARRRASGGSRGAR